MKSFILAVLAIVTLSGCGSSISGEPMPMTEQGAYRLNQAAGTANAQGMFMGAVGDPEEVLEVLRDISTQMFENAGYSLEATLVAVDQGLNHGSEDERKAYAEASYIALPMVLKIAQMFDAVSEKAEKDLDEYLHEDAAEAAHGIAKHIRR